MKCVAVGAALLALVCCTQAFNWTAYYDIDDINEWLESMAEAYPENAELINVGNSYEDRPILGLKIRGGEPCSKKVIMIEAGIHAREWVVPATTTYFINQLLTNSSMTRIRNAVDWHIFPSVNPDGYHYSHTTDRYWRKNRTPNPGMNSSCWGTDLNRNFDYNWNYTGVESDPCGLTYPGASVFSEVEAQHLSKYILALGDDLLVYTGFHTDEQTVYVPYSDSSVHIPDYDEMVTVGKKMISYASRINGTEFYGPATADEISYPASGMSPDWVYKALGTKFSYTIELRGIDFEWPEEFIYVQGQEMTEMMIGLVDGVTELGYL